MATGSPIKPAVFPSVVEDFFKPWNEFIGTPNLFGRMNTLPAVNISEDRNFYKLSLATPGLKKEDLKIDLEENMLTISCEKESSSEEKNEKITRREYNYSSFTRSFTLPDNVIAESIDARYSDGVLNIMLPKKDRNMMSNGTKKIEVK
jgi:HSP20 family protein